MIVPKVTDFGQSWPVFEFLRGALWRNYFNLVWNLYIYIYIHTLVALSIDLSCLWSHEYFVSPIKSIHYEVMTINATYCWKDCTGWTTSPLVCHITGHHRSQQRQQTVSVVLLPHTNNVCNHCEHLCRDSIYSCFAFYSVGFGIDGARYVCDHDVKRGRQTGVHSLQFWQVPIRPEDMVRAESRFWPPLLLFIPLLLIILLYEPLAVIARQGCVVAVGMYVL